MVLDSDVQHHCLRRCRHYECEVFQIRSLLARTLRILFRRAFHRPCLLLQNRRASVQRTLRRRYRTSHRFLSRSTRLKTFLNRANDVELTRWHRLEVARFAGLSRLRKLFAELRCRSARRLGQRLTRRPSTPNGRRAWTINSPTAKRW